MSIENAKSMKSAVRGIVTSAKNQRDKIQLVLDFAGSHLAAHRDPVHFEFCINEFAEVKSINTTTMIGYIKAAYPVSITVVDNKYKLSLNKEWDEDGMSLRNTPWWEYNKPKTEKEDFSLEQLKKYLKRKAEATEGVSQEALVMAALAYQAIVDKQAEE